MWVRRLMSDIVLWIPRKAIDFICGVGWAREIETRKTEA